MRHREAVAVASSTKPPQRFQRTAGGASRLRDCLKSAARRHREMDFSLVVQLDGLAYAMTGVRVERDVLAATESASYTEQHGLLPFEACSSFFGLYYTDMCHMPRIVESLHDKHVCGVFVVPVWKGQGPRLGKQQLPWFEYLISHALLIVDLPGEATCGYKPHHGVQAIVANFGYIGRLKQKRRPEKRFRLQVVDGLRRSHEARGGHLRVGPVPTMLTMVSPLAEDSRPTADQDTVRASPPLAPEQVSPTPPEPARRNYDLGVLESWAADYPYEKVAELALQVAGEGVDPFVGDITKHVPRKNGRTSPEDMAIFRENWVAEAALGRVWGPSPLPPFKAFRTCPIFSVPKAKYDPTDERVRMISNFAAGGEESVNSLCYTPRPVYVSLRPHHLRDRIAHMTLLHGKGVRAWTADKPSCFRWNCIATRLLPLFVYMLETKEHGVEWVVDLCNPFGCTFAEWGNQMVLAVERWNFVKHGLHDLDTYVDNYFHFVPPGDDFEARCEAIEALFRALGIPLHERMLGQIFKGLGWMWDIHAMEMVCPEDKFNALCSLLAVWAAATVLSLADVHRAVGFMLWLSAGFRVGRGELAHLTVMRTKGDAVHRRTGRRPCDVMIAVSPGARVCLSFWHRFFPTWSRRTPIQQHFGPTASWEVLARVDASTDWGCGGFAAARGAVSLPWFAHEWTDKEEASAHVVDRMSTGVLECRAIHRWLQLFGERFAGRRVLMECDNSSAVLGVEAAYSGKEAMIVEIVAIRRLSLRYNIILRTHHILGQLYNTLADCLSHDRISLAREVAVEEFGCPLDPAGR